MKIDFDGIQAFVAIADLGSFVKAARELHITQTALTRRLQKLESYFNLRLLDRTTRQVELTSLGREFLPQARGIVQQMTSAVERLRDVALRGAGNITLACIPSMTSHVLPRVIERYSRRYPDNRIQIFDGTSNEVRNAVLNGQAELGIALAGDKHPDLQESAWLNDPLVFICQQRNPLGLRNKVSWSDLHGIEMVGVSRFAATRELTDYSLAERGLNLQTKYEVQHHAIALNLVAAGVGSAVLPSSTFVEGDRPGLRKIPLVDPTIKRKVVLLLPKRATMSPAAAAFVGMLKQFTIKA